MADNTLDDVLKMTAEALAKAQASDDALALAKRQGFPGQERVVRWAERMKRIVLLPHGATELRREIRTLAGTLIDLLELGNLPEGLDPSEITMRLFEYLPTIRDQLAADVEAAYAGDPAAKSFGEILAAYPSIRALTMHRIAHQLYLDGVPVIPRIMSEHSHDQTGIDIHPGANIGGSFFIDHGTGVVIGETTDIGDRVKLYQGVTLGAVSFPRDGSGEMVRDQKRHPTIEDDVTIYAEATILGGDTVIGRGSVIGGNVWLTESVPPGPKVMSGNPDYEIRQKSKPTP